MPTSHPSIHITHTHTTCSGTVASCPRAAPPPATPKPQRLATARRARVRLKPCAQQRVCVRGRGPTEPEGPAPPDFLPRASPSVVPLAPAGCLSLAALVLAARHIHADTQASVTHMLAYAYHMPMQAEETSCRACSRCSSASAEPSSSSRSAMLYLPCLPASYQLGACEAPLCVFVQAIRRRHCPCSCSRGFRSQRGSAA